MGTQIQKLFLLGLNFSAMRKGQVLSLVEHWIKHREPRRIITANVDFLRQSQESSEIARIFWNGDLILCDGTPIFWASRLLGPFIPERVAGSDLLPELLELAVQGKWRVFFLGGVPGKEAEYCSRLSKRFPGLQIAGFIAPPFAAVEEFPSEQWIRQIKISKADLLLVGLGCPKQELWLGRFRNRLPPLVSMGVGASIDFLTGCAHRAPGWMRASCLEWLYRFIQEPGRLGGRYLKDASFLVTAFFHQWWAQQRGFSQTNNKPGMKVVGEMVLSATFFHQEQLPSVDAFIGEMQLKQISKIDFTCIQNWNSQALAWTAQLLMAQNASGPVLEIKNLPARIVSFYESFPVIRSALRAHQSFSFRFPSFKFCP